MTRPRYVNAQHLAGAALPYAGEHPVSAGHKDAGRAALPEHALRLGIRDRQLDFKVLVEQPLELAFMDIKTGAADCAELGEELLRKLIDLPRCQVAFIAPDVS
jgi:hypothetical protein